MPSKKIADLAEFMHNNLTVGKVPDRGAYIKEYIEQVEVIIRKSVFSTGVPGFIRNWRTQRDSNARPLPSEGSTLSS